MDEEVENLEESETSKSAVLAEPATIERRVIARLRIAVGDEVIDKIPQFAEMLVKLALQGKIQYVKLVIDMLEALVKDRAAAVIRIERSIAEEWGVEPDWNDGCCIHCVKIGGGDHGAAA